MCHLPPNEEIPQGTAPTQASFKVNNNFGMDFCHNKKPFVIMECNNQHFL
jgi:hypothetical protein